MEWSPRTTRFLHSQLLVWFQENARKLPWRTKRSNPYYRWLSEIMLQQTRVETVLPYFKKFTKEFPTVTALAAADSDTIQNMWAGLGYYSRARNLHKCAKIVATEYNGRFPNTASELRELPGIGPYTAAAIASMAFDENIAAVDGNLERVLARFLGLREVAKGNAKIEAFALDIAALGDAGSVNEALMDLSSGVCKVKNPDCLVCPLGSKCETRRSGDFEIIPMKAPKPAKIELDAKGVFFYRKSRGKAEFLLARRPKGAWLGGMWDLPWTVEIEPTISKLPGSKEAEATVKRTITNHKIRFTVEARRLKASDKVSELQTRLRAYGSEFRWAQVDSEDYSLPRPSERALQKIRTKIGLK